MNKKQKTFRFSLRVCMTGILMFLIASVYAQDISVGGSVKDANGEPVIGATINVEGTKTATVTNADGMYIIKCSPKASLIINVSSG